MMIAATEE